MADARSAARLGTRRCAVGLDLGAPVLEVARRGFSSTFSNQMGQLGRWITMPVGDGRPQPPPVLHLSDDVVAAITARDAGDADEIERVGIAAPSWLGWADRHHVARLVDPWSRTQLVWASTPVVAAFATSAVGTGTLSAEVVVAIDLDLGVSGSVVSIDRTGIREVAAAGAPPARGTRAETVAAVVDELASRARAARVAGANRIVLVADPAGSGSLVETAIRALDHPWGECPIDIVRSRADIARAAIELADLDGLEIVGVAPRSLVVLLEDDPRQAVPSVHVVIPRLAATPLRATARVDIGADDGTEVYLDLYEEQDAAEAPAFAAHDAHGYRLVMTARLEPGSRPPAAIDGDGGEADETLTLDEADLTVTIGEAGTLRLEPGTASAGVWSCSWAPSSIVVSTAELLRAHGDRVPLAGTLTGAPAPPTSRELAPPMGLAEALGRAERAVSRRIGRMVAIRSAMALLGVPDRDATPLHERADRLEAVLDRCADGDAERSLRTALEVARRAVDGPLGRVHAGGTRHDVSRELERVVEHLSVVIGAVTPAERNRLVFDAQLLGLDHDHARSLVHELIAASGVDSDGPPDELHDPTATVVVSPAGWRLEPAGSPPRDGEASIRVVLLDG